MAYIQDTYYLGDYIATEIKFIGRNGAKGERRAASAAYANDGGRYSRADGKAESVD